MKEKRTNPLTLLSYKITRDIYYIRGLENDVLKLEKICRSVSAPNKLLINITRKI